MAPAFFWKKGDVLIAMQALCSEISLQPKTYGSPIFMVLDCDRLWTNITHDGTPGVLIGGETPPRNFLRSMKQSPDP